MKNNSMDCLIDFKQYVKNDLSKYCRDKYGKRVCGRYINETLSNMLEAFEEQIELAGLEVIRDDDLNYDQDYQGD